MHCYVCAMGGKETPAIGMCIVCGMHLCKDHLIRSDIDMWEGGYPISREGKGCAQGTTSLHDSFSEPPPDVRCMSVHLY